MRVLIVKTSSLGDIIHTLPALTDACKYIPNISFDWVVEESFQDLPRLHPAVKNIIPFAFRRIRKNFFKPENRKALAKFFTQLRAEKYDLIIDAQGLMKSAWIGAIARGPVYGLDWKSAREPLASVFYGHHLQVNFHQHAIVRMRAIFAKALGYSLPTDTPVALDSKNFANALDKNHPYFVCLHGTSWENKRWPLTYWQALIRELHAKNYAVLIPWGNEEEHEQAILMQQSLPNVRVLPKQTIPELVTVLTHAKGVIAVDTGLGHLAAALGIPCVSLYGPTNPSFTGTVGENQFHLIPDFPCAPCMQRQCHYQGEDRGVFPPCFSTIPPAIVLAELSKHKLL